MAIRLKPLDQQVIVITGASSGIGLATAQLAAEFGARVGLIARNGPALAAIVEEIGAAGGQAAYAVADVGDEQQLGDAADQIARHFGRIDTWVNNAGVAIYAPLIETPEDEHQRLFRTNYFGVVHGCRIAVTHLRESGGALITVGSIAGDIPSPIMGAYTASKHAVRAFVESLRIELLAAALPIQVTLVKPSGMATPIAEHSANHQAGAARIPPPVYDPQLVANAILDCAVRPRRQITVGGIGRLQVLFGQHLPRLFDRLAPLVIPLLQTPSKPAELKSNLWTPAKDGQVLSGEEAGRPISAYAGLTNQPWPAAMGIASITLVLAFCVRRKPT